MASFLLEHDVGLCKMYAHNN